MIKNDIPLYVVGLPEDEPNIELVTSKFKEVLKRVQKVFSTIQEARISIKTMNKEGGKQTYEAVFLVVTTHERFSYKESGWDLSEICESVGQKLLREFTKDGNKRQKESIRKITEKKF